MTSPPALNAKIALFKRFGIPNIRRLNTFGEKLLLHKERAADCGGEHTGGRDWVQWFRVASAETKPYAQSTLSGLNR